jgi:capsular polysaccharide transport system permease protein
MALVEKRSPLQIWGDVIFAIFLREIKSQFSDKFGISWSVISPVAFIMMLSFLRGRLDGGETHTIPVFFFMLYGLILIQFFMGLVGAVSGAIKKNKPLYAFRQVQPISSVIAIAIFQFLVKIFVVVLLVVICYLLRFEIKVADAISIIIIFMQVWLISVSLGVLFAIAASFVPEISKIQSLAMRPMFFISGVFFSLQDIPQEYWHYLDWNPFLHAIELTRYAAYPTYGHAGVSDFYLNMFTICSVFLALACYHISWKQVISR